MLTDLARVVLNIAWTADILATVTAIVIGVIWYHPRVFGTAWTSMVNGKKDNTQSIQVSNTTIWNIPIMFVVAANIAAFCKYFEFDTPQKAFLIGYDFGLIVCLFMAMNFIRDRRPFLLYCINA